MGQPIFFPTECFSCFHGWTQDLNKWAKKALLCDTIGENLGKFFFGILSFYYSCTEFETTKKLPTILNKLETPHRDLHIKVTNTKFVEYSLVVILGYYKEITK